MYIKFKSELYINALNNIMSQEFLWNKIIPTGLNPLKYNNDQNF